MPLKHKIVWDNAETTAGLPTTLNTSLDPTAQTQAVKRGVQTPLHDGMSSIYTII